MAGKNNGKSLKFCDGFPVNRSLENDGEIRLFPPLCPGFVPCTGEREITGFPVSAHHACRPAGRVRRWTRNDGISLRFFCPAGLGRPHYRRRCSLSCPPEAGDNRLPCSPFKRPRKKVESEWNQKIFVPKWGKKTTENRPFPALFPGKITGGENGIQEVSGSIPLISTNRKKA